MWIRALLVVTIVGLGFLGGRALSPTPTAPLPETSTDETGKSLAATTSSPAVSPEALPAASPIAEVALSGNGILEGTVTWSSFQAVKPVSGARVFLEPVGNNPMRAATAQEFMDRQSRRREVHQARSRQTVADRQGRFVFDDLVSDVQYKVTVEHEGRRVTSALQYSCGSSCAISLPRRPNQAVAIFVRHEGRDLTSGQVEVLDVRGHVGRLRRRAWSNQQLTLNPGTYQIRAFHLNEYVSEFREVTVPTSEPLRFEVAPCSFVLGEIAINTDWWECVVRLSTQGDWEFAGCSSAEIAVDRYGLSSSNRIPFKLLGIAPGPWRVQLYGTNPTEQSWDLELIKGANFVSLEADPATSSSHERRYRVAISEEGGLPVTGLKDIATMARMGNLSSGNRESVEELQAGLYEFTLSTHALEVAEGRKEGSLEVAAVLEERGRYGVEWDLAEWQRVHEIVVPRRAIVHFRVPGYVGSGHEGYLRVTLRAVGSDSPFDFDPFRESADPCPNLYGEGAFEVGATPHILNATVRASFARGSRGTTYFTQRLDVRPGEQHIVIPLPDVHAVRLIVPADLLDKHMSIRACGDTQEAWSGKGADLPELLLPTGEYFVRAHPHGMAFRVEAPLTLYFEPADSFSTLAVVRLGREHPFDDQLQLGDRIVAVDGKPFSTSTPWGFIQQHSQGKDTLRLTLWRKGETIEVTLEAPIDARHVNFIGALPPKRD